MKFKLFALGILCGVFFSSGVNAGALIPACNNALVPADYGECIAQTQDCMKCTENAPRQVQACLCFGQQPASYNFFMNDFTPINVNPYYIDPETRAKVTGPQSGVCMNADNAGCDVWQYFRGLCKNWIPLIVNNGQSSISVGAGIYCEILQGRVDGEKCVDLPTANGMKECNLSDLAQGSCELGL